MADITTSRPNEGAGAPAADGMAALALLNAAIPRAREIVSQDSRSFSVWLAAQCSYMAGVHRPTCGVVACAKFFRTLSTPSIVNALLDPAVRGVTLEAARDVLLDRFLTDDDTEAEIIAVAWREVMNDIEAQASRIGAEALAERAAQRDAAHPGDDGAN